MKSLNKEIIDKFDFKGSYVGYDNKKTGLINGTFTLLFKEDDGTDKKYILQRINTGVFKEPAALMENIEKVTKYIQKIAVSQGKNPARSTLNIIRTKADELYYVDADGDYWRAYDFIEGCITCDKVEKPEDFYSAGVALGIFQKTLAEYPSEELVETIKNFHNTPSRYGDFCKAIEENRAERKDSVGEEIAFFKAREGFYSIVTDGIANGTVPLRVTHNDTKFNNVMLDKETGEVVCLIDLDTVMPGSALYDFGDSIRSGTNTAAEDEVNLDKICFDMELFEAYVNGYLCEMRDYLTDTEKRLLADSAILMTLECGMRFLTDYLNGDTYFSVKRINHNLDRARNQIKLVCEMEKNIEKMRRIVNSAL